MSDVPITLADGLVHFTDGFAAAAGRDRFTGTYPLHTHSLVEISCVVSGTGTQVSPQGAQHLSRGDAVVLRPGASHELRDCQDLEIINCWLGIDLLRGELAWARHDPLLGYLLWDGPYAPQRYGMLTCALRGEELAQALEHLEAILALTAAGRVPGTRARYRADLMGRLMLVLGQLARSTSANRARVATQRARAHPAVIGAIELLESDVARRWTPAELADRFCLDPHYLTRIFKATTGLPLMAYQARLRAEAAAVALLHTDEPVARIGNSVGWPDQNYFARRFRAHFGLSPSAYRGKEVRDERGSAMEGRGA